MNRIRVLLALSWLVFPTAPIWAHYNILLPQTASAKRGETVTLLYQWGHPFEHQLFDAPQPQSLVVWAPDGKRTDLSRDLEKIEVPGEGQKKVAAYRFLFTPEQRGDFSFVLTTPPIWIPEEEKFFEDSVRVTLHVQTQKGWDVLGGAGPSKSSDDFFGLAPLTRPYGLQRGMVFQAQAWTMPKADSAGREPVPLRHGQVEIERYNAVAPKELPPDEHITRSVRTDPNGVATTTLTEPGWWGLTALRSGPAREHNGKKYPVQQRATLWVFVDELPK
jgi:cobalt/nickel transport protein